MVVWSPKPQHNIKICWEDYDLKDSMFGGGGGGGMLKVVGRSVTRAGVTNLQETISSSSSTTTTTGSTAAATSPTAVSSSTHKHHPLNSSPNNNNNNLMLSGSQFPSCNSPVYATHNNNNNVNGIASWPGFSSGLSCDDQYEWVSVDATEEERVIGVSDDDFDFAPVPSAHEVHTALSALTQVFDAASYSQLITDKYGNNFDTDVVDQISSPTGLLRHVSPVGSEADWIDPDPHLCNSRMLHPYGPDRVYDAFHLLQNEPSVQRMVISLSSDKAVWDAVLNNEVVRELRQTYNAEENNTSPPPEGSDETSHDSNPTLNAVKWIFQNTVAKFMEVFKKITNLMNELFKTPDNVGNEATGKMDPFEEKLRTSFLLSVVVLLVVVVARAHRA